MRTADPIGRFLTPAVTMDQVDVTVYYLQMRQHVARPLPPPRDDLIVLHAQQPSVRYYRFLYNGVGEDYRWLSRRKLDDASLAAIIHDPRVEVHVLHAAGCAAGFAELDRRQDGEIELKQFGLMPEFIGQGLGRWFLQWAIDRAFSYQPQRFWLHTCTLDHPGALPNYFKAGFEEYKREHLRREY